MTLDRERPVEFLAGCPRCGEEPEEWCEMSEFDCACCKLPLVTHLRYDAKGAKHWYFTPAFEGDDSRPFWDDPKKKERRKRK